MEDDTRLKNLLVFLSILFGENRDISAEIMNFSPEYLMEKWERYMQTCRKEYAWGLHPILRKGFYDVYLKKWGLCND